MDMNKWKKLLARLAAAYWTLAILIYLVAQPQFRYANVASDAMYASMTVGEIVDGMEIRQRVTVPAQRLTEVSLMTATYGRRNTGVMLLTLADETGAVVAQEQADIAAFSDGVYSSVVLDEPLTGYKGKQLDMTITTTGCAPGNAVTLYAGNVETKGRFDVAQSIEEADRYTVNGQLGMGKLCVNLCGVDALGFYRTYWLIVSGLFAALALLCARWWKQAKENRNNPLVALCTLFTRYFFLLKQLVGREFKKKYKRSVLGMAWSFLNPLLTMLVQYIVFSKLFNRDTPNYPVYLLSGVIFMNFFNETVAQGMTSITGNASLIRKVYIPKYIFPITRSIASLINFLISLIPLMLVMLITDVMPRPSLLLLPFDILCLLGFVIGMGLLLTTAMTFFQDTQFLWRVVSMMWMYLTPVFYPESIIPARLLTLYHMNPMYQYITFARICIIDGVSPAPAAYLWCALSSLVVFVLGVVVFRKNQDKFILHL